MAILNPGSFGDQLSAALASVLEDSLPQRGGDVRGGGLQVVPQCKNVR